MKFKIIFVVFILCPLLLPARNDFERDLQRNRSMLQQLKSEIASIKTQISRAKKQEHSMLQQIALIDKEVSLIAQARGILERESRIIQKNVKENDNKLKQTVKRFEKLKNLYAERAVYSYKYGRVRNLELLLTSSSFNQALIRYRYLKLIAEHDERTIQTIENKKKEIEQIQQKLATSLKLKKTNLREKKREEANYTSRKSQKSSLLKKLRWNQSTYKKQLVVKQREKEKLDGIILALERERKRKEKTGEPEVFATFDFDDFAKARGKLSWPVRGKVITRYGKQRDPKSKTYIRNTDIEIQSTLGTPVKCVFTGVVRMITYLPGYGNTIIVDHGKGYYTVYSHLDQVYIQKNDFIKSGEVIATVGDSGSLAGAKLQFGIYGGQKTYDPQKWLRKKQG